MLEYTLQACAFDFKKVWDEQLALIQFSYNNIYHFSIGMGAYEAICARRCRTPLCWQEIDELLTIGPEFIQATIEKVMIIQEQMRVARSRLKCYADQRHRPLEFTVGDWVFLKVSSNKRITRFGMASKLSPRYIGHYSVTQ